MYTITLDAVTFIVYIYIQNTLCVGTLCAKSDFYSKQFSAQKMSENINCFCGRPDDIKKIVWYGEVYCATSIAQ